MDCIEAEFIGENHLVSIIPTFNEAVIHLICGDVGFGKTVKDCPVLTDSQPLTLGFFSSGDLQATILIISSS